MDITTYYKLNFSLIQHHKWSGEYVDNLYPFERDLYVGMLQDYLDNQQQSTEGARYDNPTD